MQVTETLNEGLKREFKVVVPVHDLNSKLSTRLEDMRARANIPGFRPGKVPIAHLKRLYGKSAMAEVVNDAVGEATRSIATDHKLKLAAEPKVTFPEDEAELTAVIEGRGDLAYTVAIEILPAIEVGDFKKIKLVKDVTEVTETDIDEALTRIADQNRPFSPRPESEAAQDGDRLTIDFVGTIDGEAFEGGTSQGINLVLGSKSFIPGFEDQLIGVKAGEERTVNVTFPEEYQAPHLAGKAASFAVKVTEVAAPGEVKLDDEFAKTLGIESFDKLREAIKDQIAREDSAQSRRRLKRRLLDVLDGEYQFDLPPSLVEQEVEAIWRNLTADMERAGKSFADEGTSEEEAKADYRKIAERRVRLGLLLAEVGEKNEIKVLDEEINRALFERARQFPGQERQLIEFYRKTPEALAELRAPIFEEKAVDFILELAEISENKIERAALFAEEADGGAEAEVEEKPKAKRSRKKAE